MVPAEVAERFEHWEDIYWSRRAAEVLDRNEPTVPWEEAITELEIGDGGTGARSSRRADTRSRSPTPPNVATPDWSSGITGVEAPRF